MASTPSSFSTSEYKYDIFLSFRGEDTREIFTTRLHSALINANFGTFIDDKNIVRGEVIKSELVEAIRHSRCSIVVLSENYANSSWCLDELAMIVENKKKTGHVILPVFYYVTPTQVGKQMGSFESAFEMFEEQIMEESDEKKKDELINRVKKWRAALTAVADIEGMVLRVQEDDRPCEAGFIQKIVSVIEDKLSRAVLCGAPSLIGISYRVRYISLWLQDRSSNVSLLVIYGVGGVGKSTVAKYAYNLHFERFQVRVVLENFRETSQKPNGLVLLQRKLLSDIGSWERINSVNEGINKIKDALRHKQFLLVLDDVDQIEQVNAVLGKRDWFSFGSKVIITTRHKFRLEPHEDYKIVEVEPLDYRESSELFSWYAFGQDHPTSEAYKALASRVVIHCEGIPLAIKVLGSSLSGKSLDVWKSILKKVELVPANGIMKLLRISYDSLKDDHDRNLFLHIACFFGEKDKNFVVNILDACNFQTTVGLQILTERSLLVIDEHNKLRMHQLLQDMGREVVRQESPKNPEKRSRLWRHKDSFNVLRDKNGTIAIEGLILDMRLFLINEFGDDGLKIISDIKIFVDGFEKMQNLRILQLDDVHVIGDYKNFPKKLRWLCWDRFPYKSIPVSFPLETIVVLKLSNSQLIRFWKKAKIAECMKILDLSYSRKLVRTPKFSLFPNLETLLLEGCVSLSEVHESIGNVKTLTHLDLTNCTSLLKLPKSLVMLKFLETLIISGCSNLDGLPMEMNSMSSLKVLKANGFTQRISTSGDVDLRNACLWFGVRKPRKVLDISCSSFPHSLVSLSLAYCNLSQHTFPRDLSRLISLQELDLSGNKFGYLPEFVKSLGRLQSLTMANCKRLGNLSGLPDIKYLNVTDCGVLETVQHVSASHKIQDINYESCTNLMTIQGYFHLTSISKLHSEILNTLGLFELEPMINVKVNMFDGIRSSIEQRPNQLLYEFGIFSASFPAKEIPNWFHYKSTGTSISTTVPSVLNLKPHGINICFLYTRSELKDVETWFPEHQLFAKLTNRTKNLKWIYNPICFSIPEADNDFLWLSYWTLNDQLAAGDEIDVSIIAGESLKVRECAINLVYQKRSTYYNNLSWKEVIGGDLSAFKLSTGEYFLCRTRFFRNDEVAKISRVDDWTTTQWGKSLFGESEEIFFKEVGYMRYGGIRSPLNPFSL